MLMKVVKTMVTVMMSATLKPRPKMSNPKQKPPILQPCTLP